MADKNKTSAQQDQLKEKLQQLSQKFQELPRGGQLGIIAGVVIVFLVLFGGNGGRQAPQQQVQQAQAQQPQSQGEVFSGLNIDTPELMQSWFEQSERDVAKFKDELEKRLVEQDANLSAAMRDLGSTQQNVVQTLDEFKAQLISMQESDRRDREVLGQLAEETRRLQQASPIGNEIPVQGSVAPRQKKRISQNILASTAGGVAVDGRNALLSPVVDGVDRTLEGENPVGEEEDTPQPFIPPLGFIKASLLNGVDALVGSTATPALARLHGTYKTAGNGTVNLDGCFVMLEFSGEISTERAVGKPSRMTCVYPDQGVASYSVSGYIVDAEDGIIGVPGVFYEGDASRLATAMIADFAAGISDIITTNQSTFTVDSEGNAQQVLTGDETKAQLAGGINSAVSSLRDYLMERANRVVPFVRIDATRTVHLVLLSGIELRTEGSPWTLLFAADD